MIRKAECKDIQPIVAIYNEYVIHSTATFDINPVSENEMLSRMKDISSVFPYLVYEEEGEVIGYCYAHYWKEKAAYKHTFETTVYVSPAHHKHGVGYALMTELIDQCRKIGASALIACITGGNDGSISLHKKLGFHRVSKFEKVGIKFGKTLDVEDYELLLR